MKLTNEEIYSLYLSLKDIRPIKFPIKVGFALTKNIKTLTPLVESIEEIRLEIIRSMGIESDYVPADKRDELNSKLTELSLIENEVSLSGIKISELGSAELTLETLEYLYPILDDSE